MTRHEALSTLERLTESVTNKRVTLTEETDLKRDEILDSVDALVFFMTLDSEAGVNVPESADLVAEGYYDVKRLVDLLVAQAPA